MFPIANIIFYFNKGNLINDPAFYVLIKEYLTSEIEKVFSETEVYEGIRLSYYCPNKEEIGVIVFLRFVGIYQTELNHRIVFSVVNNVIGAYKNKIIKDVEEKYESLIAIKSFEIIKTNEIIEHLEKYYSKIVQNTKDELYDIHVEVEQIIKDTVNNIKRNQYFLECHRTTKFHDIDIKIWETRQALASGLSLTAIIMLGVTLEECLKTVLKSDYEQQIRKKQSEASLSSLSTASLEAEEKYGDLSLYQLIVALQEANFINEEERRHLIHIKDYIRNAFIHSDKSKIFDANSKTSVTAFRLIDNKIEYVETKELSMLQMSFAQGIMQKKLATENAKLIFYEIEEYIYKISIRFWDKWK